MAKRFTKPTINWVELEKRVPPDQKAQYLNFKTKSDGYYRRVMASPPEPPKIDWETYQKTVPIPGLVEKFKKEYEAFKVPSIPDTLTDKVDAQWKTIESEIKSFCAERQKEIDAAKKEIGRINALPSFEDMTMEMFYDLYPDIALDPVKRPTFWPHDPTEQPGYVAPAEPSKKKGK